MTIEDLASILAVRIEELSDLQAAYMPFLTHGGLFIPLSDCTKNQQDKASRFELYDNVCLLLRLLDDPATRLCLTTVAWITPAQRQSQQAAGIGLHFHRHAAETKTFIEDSLQRSKSAPAPCQTL